MQTVFLSYSFDDADRELAAHVERVVASHGIRAIKGKVLGGGPLTDEVRRMIERSDALVALMTFRDKQDACNGTHCWVRDELNHARALRKPAIALVADRVGLVGMDSENERIKLSPDGMVEALVKLGETIALWKEQAGDNLLVRIEPDDAARRAADGGNARCKYRLLSRGQTLRDWTHVVPQEEPGGLFLYLSGIRPDHLIEISVEDNEQKWRSPAHPQYVRVGLTRRDAQP